MEAIAETKIGHALRYEHFAQQGAIGGDAVHTIAGAAPEISMLIHPEAIGPARRDFVENLSAGEGAAILTDIKHADVLPGLQRTWCSRFGHIELALIRRKGQPIGTVEVGGHPVQVPARGIEAIEGRRLVGNLATTFVIIDQAIERITKPHTAVAFHHNVVRCVEPFAIGLIHQGGGGAVVLQTGEVAAAVMAGDQAPLAVPGLAVAVVGGFPEDGNPMDLTPAQGAVVGEVVEQQALVIAKPNRTLKPAKAVGQQLQFSVEQDQAFKTGVVAFGARGEEGWGRHGCGWWWNSAEKARFGSPPGIVVALNNQLHIGFIPYLGGEMSPFAIRGCDAALIGSEGIFAGIDNNFVAIHAFHRPGSSKHVDPFGNVVLMPVRSPADREVGHKGIALISYTAFTSVSFSFNSSITSVNATAVNISVQTYQSTYFSLLAFQYMLSNHSTL